MNGDFGDGVLAVSGVIIMLAIGATIGGCTNELHCRIGFEKEAVSHGAATFEKRADGEIIFRWKDVK